MEKKTKKTIKTSLEANLMNEPMSALFFFCSWLKLIVIFLTRNTKKNKIQGTQATKKIK